MDDIREEFIAHLAGHAAGTGDDRRPAWERLAALGEEQRFDAEQVMTRQFAPASHLFLVADGALRFRIRLDEGNEDLDVGHRESPWSAVGWSGFGAPRRYATTVVCASPCRALRFDHAALAALFADEPELGAAVLRPIVEQCFARLAWMRSRLTAYSRVPVNFARALRDEGEEETYNRAPPPVLDLLRRSAFFEVFDESGLRALAGAVESRYFCRGEPIVEQGDAAPGLWVLATGRVALNYRPASARKAFALRVISDPGAVVALAGLPGVETQPASVVAVRDCTVYRIDVAQAVPSSSAAPRATAPAGAAGAAGVAGAAGAAGVAGAARAAGAPGAAGAASAAGVAGAAGAAGVAGAARVAGATRAAGVAGVAGAAGAAGAAGRDPLLALAVIRRLLWLGSTHLRAARALFISRRFEKEKLAISNLLEQSCTQLSVHSPLHVLPHLLRHQLTVGDAFGVIEQMKTSPDALERSLAELCEDMLGEVQREHEFFEALRRVYHAVVTAPPQMPAADVRKLCARGFQNAFRRVRHVVEGERHLPETPGHIFIFNHLKNHEHNTLPNNFQLTLDSHFVSAMILDRRYGDSGIRVVRKSRGTEYGHQEYYDRLGHLSVYTHESDRIEETAEERETRRSEFFETAGRYLSSGTNLILSPEGTSYWTEDSPGPFKPGAFRLAASVAPEPWIVPLAVANFDRRIHSTVCAVVIKKPFKVSEALDDIGDREKLARFLVSVRTAYRSYVEEARRLARSAAASG